MSWSFVHIPKTGGTSICVALYGGDAVEHLPASRVPRPRFAFVRHPLDRLVSAWEFVREAPTERLRSAKRDATTFDEFVRLPDDGVFLNAQSYWLDDEMDFVGRFERLHEDFATISDRPLSHLRASVRGPWQEYYDPDTLAYAVNRYNEDFARFGYVA